MGKDDRRCSRQADPDDVGEPRGNMLHMTAELVPAFSGRDKTYSIARWVQDVEDHAEIFSWTPLQQLLVARRALTGTAALWLRAERPHKTWDELKAALSKEFSDTVDVKAIHEIMSARKKQPNESCLDYMLVMKELGKRGKMADYVAIKYVIDGIEDKEINKMMLYGVTTYVELKEKLKIYEAIKDKLDCGVCKSYMPLQNVSRLQARQGEDRQCFNCGEIRHISAECPHKYKGAKCFNCNSFGHVASQCSSVRQGGSGERRDGPTVPSQQQRYVHVRAGNMGRPRSNSESASNRNSASTYCCDHEMERNPTDVVDGSTDEYQDGGDCDQCECKVKFDADININTVNIQQNVEKPIKSLEICGKSVDALIDSGSDVNLISSECYRGLGSLACETSDIVMMGLGATKVRAIGLLSATVCIDGQKYRDISFYIVPNNVMPYSIIVGQQLLRQTVMVMDNNKVFLLPANEEWLRKIMCVVSDLDVIGREVGPAVQQRGKHMMASYAPLKTKEAPIELQINLKDDIPLAQRPRRLAFKEQQGIDGQIQQWLDDDIIRVSTSEYSSPIVLVRKKDRKLNQKMVKDQYPLPIIDSHIDRCQSAKIFSALDLKNGYFHLRVHEHSVQYTSFVTMTRPYEFLRAPFGIAICPKVFTRFISIVCKHLIAKGTVIIFIDDW